MRRLIFWCVAWTICVWDWSLALGAEASSTNSIEFIAFEKRSEKVYSNEPAWNPEGKTGLLEKTSFLSDRDLAWIDPGAHKFALTKEGAIRLSVWGGHKCKYPQPSKAADGRKYYEFYWPDTPFVLSVGATPIYVAVLSSPRSSTGYTRVPVVMTMSPALPVDFTNEVIFQIGAVIANDHWPDPREDPRILNAISKFDEKKRKAQ